MATLECGGCGTNTLQNPYFYPDFNGVYTGAKVRLIPKSNGLYSFEWNFPLNNKLVVPGTVVLTVDNQTPTSDYVADDVTATTNPNGCRQLQTASSATAVGEICSYTGNFKGSIEFPSGAVVIPAGDFLNTLVLQYQTNDGQTRKIIVGEFYAEDPCATTEGTPFTGWCLFVGNVCAPNFCQDGDVPQIFVLLPGESDRQLLATGNADGTYSIVGSAFSDIAPEVYSEPVAQVGFTGDCGCDDRLTKIIVSFNGNCLPAGSQVFFKNGAVEEQLSGPAGITVGSRCTYTWTFSGTALTEITSLQLNGANALATPVAVTGANLAAQLTNAAASLSALLGLTFTAGATTLVVSTTSTMGPIVAVIDAAPTDPALAPVVTNCLS